MTEIHIPLPLENDDVHEMAEQFRLVLSTEEDTNTVILPVTHFVVTIRDDDGTVWLELK